MKRIAIFFMTAAILVLASGCTAKSPEKRAMARYVPERMDDFVWENDLICYRAYGPALEGNPTSPGFDIWVKLPGKLVADEWYLEAQNDENYYHHDHGGKDCYKVAVSLGGGASAPYLDGELVYPDHNWNSWEIIEDSDDQVCFELNYAAWKVGEMSVSLRKRITVTAGSYFCKCEDFYSGDFDTLTVAAGVFTHQVEKQLLLEDRFAIWEEASDQSIEPEDGMLGVAVMMEGAESVMPIFSQKPHLVCTKTIAQGESVTYYFGSCWSKGDIATAQEWFDKVQNL